MAGFLYHLPGVEAKNAIDPNTLKQFGLRQVLSDILEVPRDCVVTKCVGPSGQPGALLIPKPPSGEVPKIPTYSAEIQTWSKPKKNHQPWIGYVTDEPPRPEDLIRRVICNGYFFPDNHGRSWATVVVRGHDNPYGHLPVDYDFSEGTFEPGFVLRREYAVLWKASSRIWDHVYTEDHREPEPFVAGFVARTLAINYRIGPLELAAFANMGKPVLDRESMHQWACICVDVMATQEFADAQKKKLSQPVPGGITSMRGTAGEDLTGDPLVESCA